MKISEVKSVIREMSEDMSEGDVRARIAELEDQLKAISDEARKNNWRRYWMKKVEPGDDSTPGRYLTGEYEEGTMGKKPVRKPNKPLQDMLDTIERLGPQKQAVTRELNNLKAMLRKFEDDKLSPEELKAKRDKVELWARYGGDPAKNPRGLGT